MITGGIDLGIENVKAVILRDGKVAGRASGASGGARRGESAARVWKEAVERAGVAASDVKRVVATGQGKFDAAFAADRIVEPVADAKAAFFLYPSARAVVNVGADQVRVVTFDSTGKITEVVLNQKCGAGIGIFLRSLSKMLGIAFEEIHAAEGATVNDACPVFAGTDAVSLLHDNVPKAAILGAAIDAMAARINGVLNDKIIPEKETTVLIGGVARNRAVIAALKKRSGINFLVPEDPEFACALGAALIAAD